MKFKIFIDEAWRGPLAWPVVVWLLTCLDNFDNNIFSDSKKLSEKKREQILLKFFTTYENIKTASEEEIASLPGFSNRLAKTIIKTLNFLVHYVYL